MTERQISQSFTQSGTAASAEVDDLPSLAVLAAAGGGSAARRRNLLPFGAKKRDRDEDTFDGSANESNDAAAGRGGVVIPPNATACSSVANDDDETPSTACTDSILIADDGDDAEEWAESLPTSRPSRGVGGAEGGGLTTSAKTAGAASVAASDAPTTAGLPSVRVANAAAASPAAGRRATAPDSATYDSDGDEDDEIPIISAATPRAVLGRMFRGAAASSSSPTAPIADDDDDDPLQAPSLDADGFASPFPRKSGGGAAALLAVSASTPANAIIGRSGGVTNGTPPTAKAAAAPPAAKQHSSTAASAGGGSQRRFTVPPPPLPAGGGGGGRGSSVLLGAAVGSSQETAVSPMAALASAADDLLAMTPAGAAVLRRDEIATPQTALTQLTQEAMLSQALAGTSSSQSLLATGGGGAGTLAPSLAANSATSGVLVSQAAIDVTPLGVQLARVNEPMTVGRAAEASGDYAPPSPSVDLFGHIPNNSNNNIGILGTGGFTPLQSQTDAPVLRRTRVHNPAAAPSISVDRPSASSAINYAYGNPSRGASTAGGVHRPTRAQRQHQQLASQRAAAAAAVEALFEGGDAEGEDEGAYGGSDVTAADFTSPDERARKERRRQVVSSAAGQRSEERFDLGVVSGHQRPIIEEMVPIVATQMEDAPHGGQASSSARGGAASPSGALELSPMTATQIERREGEQWCAMAKNFFDFIDSKEPLRTVRATAPIIAAVAAAAEKKKAVEEAEQRRRAEAAPPQATEAGSGEGRV